ncbi:LysR family transcriptional regulator [Eikenella sp. S3360]|uniref:LysR family transcriptional regulator n=1 Tax=Eikenella glucosivorans TaxID=2766967 RepID=A0ABS0N7I7_9NEIS|nr:LysR family transcriptional regulator [Eikenella glucosivorans]MBH5328224.1 LysR family transcriptional regulator [Eikenella glucosivorans]
MSRLDHLRTFLEVYRQKSVSKAAAKLSITQPAATQHIQALESLVGKKLFVRQPRGVQPTEVADDLAHSVAQSIDVLENKLARLGYGQVKGGTVHIAAPADVTHFVLAPRLVHLLADGFSVRVMTGNKERIYGLLQEERADFAITSSLPDAALYESVPLFCEQFLLVYAPQLADKIAQVGYCGAMLSATGLALFVFLTRFGGKTAEGLKAKAA